MPVTLRALTKLLPTRAEVWTYGVGSLLPLVLLTAARTRVAFDELHPSRPLDVLHIQLGELALWAVWGWAWWVGLRLVGRFAPRVWKVLFYVLTAVLCISSALDLAYFETTGSRADWEMLSYGLQDVERVWPVVASELDTARVLSLLAGLLLCLAPAARRRLSPDPGGWRAGAWLAVLAPLVWLSAAGWPKPAASALRPLQANLVSVLYGDGLERLGDASRAPSPEDLVPLQVRAIPAEELARPRPNVVMVFLESVGAKATTAYVPTLKTTPTLAKMAAEGLRVENLYTVVPHTSKALVASLCGDWPYLRAEVREAKPGGLPGRCLPELLDEVGYRTAFFQPARGDFEDRTGLVHEMGYRFFRPRGLLESPGYEKNNYFGIDDRVMIEPGLEWSTAEPGKPFFATYLTLTSHHDYTVPSHWPTKTWPDVRGRRGKYLAAVNYVDDFLGRLVDAYEEKGLLENTVFVVVGDHGEGFNEHGRSQHDLVIYDEGLRVPGVIWGPGVLDRTGVIEGQRQQIDLLPTVLDLAGVEVTAGATRGSTLLADPEERVLYHSCWRAHRCLARREGTDKVVDLYRDAPTQRFDLAKDATERKDLAAETPPEALKALTDDARAWRSRVLGHYDAVQERWKAESQVPDAGPAAATWDGRLSLLGCEAEQAQVLPGETVFVDCRWRAEEQLGEALRLTVGARAGKAVTNATWEPGAGNLPVWEWQVGSAVADTFRVQVPWSAKPGRLDLDVGWESYSGTDLLLAEGKPRYTVATIEVVPRPKRAPGPAAVKPAAEVAASEEAAVSEP